MRAVRCKHNIVSFINTLETKLFSLAESTGFLELSTLDERNLHLAHEMYRKNIFRKVKQNGIIGYSTYEQK